MKRLFLALTVLFASVLTTACINNLAIQELNNKAKSYLEAGEADKAICRYRSSLDLDAGIFETNYNLGVAYIQKKSYKEAVEVLQNAIKSNPEQADAYYSLAVALEGVGYDKINGVESNEEINCITAAEQLGEDMQNDIKTKELNAEEKKEVSKIFMDAIDNYNQYLSINPAATDKEKVSAKVEELNAELVKYSSDATAATTED